MSLFLAQDGDLRIDLELVEMLPDQFEAEAVQRADVSGLKERQLLLAMAIGGRKVEFLLQTLPNPLSHFGGGSVAESDHQNFVKRGTRRFPQEGVKAPFDQC